MFGLQSGVLEFKIIKFLILIAGIVLEQIREIINPF